MMKEDLQSKEKQRIVQEYVPGKQVTLAHIIANPDDQLYAKIGLPAKDHGAIAILTITPSEGAIIAADTATKTADIEIGYVDRFSGSLLLSGELSDVESALEGIAKVLQDLLGFTPAPITRT